MADPRFFRNAGPFSLGQLAEKTGARIHQARHTETLFKDVSPLSEAGAEHISFLDNPKYVALFRNTKAGACIVNEKYIDKAPKDVALLISENPYFTYATIADMFYPVLASSHHSLSPSTALSATIHETASIGANCNIEPGAVIGENVEIGEGCRIRSNAVINESCIIGEHCTINGNVSISNSVIGNNVIVHQGASIGQDGFGFATEAGQHIKVPQLGRVVIHDHVEIGANTTIDRGTGPDTVIGAGTKIDNLVQIGHNVQMGVGCIIVAQVGISGSTILGNYVVIGGNAGIAGHLHIGDGAQIAAMSGVMKDVEPGARLIGLPAVPARQFHKQVLTLKKLATEKGK